MQVSGFRYLRSSLHHRFFFLMLVAVLLVAVISVAITYWLADGWLALVLSLLIAVLVLWGFSRAFFAPMQRVVQAIRDGVSSFKDADFSINIANDRQDELGELIGVYNRLANTLRQERFHLYQRELLLDTVIQTSPLALLLTNANGTVIYSNHAAHRLFNISKPEGQSLEDISAQLPEALRQATLNLEEGLLTVDTGDEQEVYHLSHRRFLLNNQRHYLYLYKQLTREFTRQEVMTWKKMIRLISHELNNSLGPVASLTSSAQQIVSRQERLDMLPEVLETIAQRTRHLHQFIERYAHFARLPAPRSAMVDWQVFIRQLQALCQFRLLGEPPTESGFFDAAQMEQVLINLLKNAHESGSLADEVVLQITQYATEIHLVVLDRGTGILPDQLQQALMPFYSTKQFGTGLGLSLCREIVEAHAGRLRLGNREGGGFMACCVLPRGSVVSR